MFKRYRILVTLLTVFCSPWICAETVTLSAASSLTNAFREIATAFENAYPEHQVQLNFAASGVLLQQIAWGAPVDILATADQVTMDQAQSQGLLQDASRRDFVRNTLVLITPADSPLHLLQLHELLQPHYGRIAVSNPESVPAGRYSRQVLTELTLWDRLSDKIIQTQNVRQSLDYVARGEVDAGFVYATDAAIMADKVSVQLRIPTQPPVLYPIAITATGTRQTASQHFIDFLFTPDSQNILARYGFLPE